MANVWKAYQKFQAEQTTGGDPPRTGEPPPEREAVAAPAARGTTESPPARARTSTGSNGYSTSLVTLSERGGPVTEKYRELRTNLVAQRNEGRFCLMVTSAAPGEGKTVTCLNLGFVLAEQPEYRVVVVDCDMRKSKVASLLHLPNEPGLAEVLRGEATLSDVIRPTASPNLVVVPAGKAEKDEVGELLGRAELDEVVQELREKYEYVLFDTPPITGASDAGTLGRVVGEAIVVVRMNKTRRESVDQAIRLLHAANVKPIGMVLTHHKYPIPNYLYRYS